MKEKPSGTKTFGVMISGTGCLVKVESEWSTKQEVQRAGFFTTRFVAASSVDEAVEKAMRIVAEDLESIVVNGADQPYELEVEQVYEYLAERDVGAGFTWYPDGE